MCGGAVYDEVYVVECGEVTPWILAEARCGLRFDHQTRQLEDETQIKTL